MLQTRGAGCLAGDDSHEHSPTPDDRIGLPMLPAHIPVGRQAGLQSHPVLVAGHQHDCNEQASHLHDSTMSRQTAFHAALSDGKALQSCSGSIMQAKTLHSVDPATASDKLPAHWPAECRHELNSIDSQTRRSAQLEQAEAVDAYPYKAAAAMQTAPHSNAAAYMSPATQPCRWQAEAHAEAQNHGHSAPAKLTDHATAAGYATGPAPHATASNGHAARNLAAELQRMQSLPASAIACFERNGKTQPLKRLSHLHGGAIPDQDGSICKSPRTNDD